MNTLDELETFSRQPLLSDPGYQAVPDDGELQVTEAAGRYVVHSVFHRVRFTFDRLTDARGGVSAELTVHSPYKELLGETDIGLKADSSRDKIAKTLKTNTDEVPCKGLLDRACSIVLKRHRQGEPTIELQPSPVSHVPYILNPLVYDGHQSLLYAPGGSCKSYLALYFALLACHGAYQAGVSGIKTPVLYLDWELNRDTVGGRLKALQIGHPELAHVLPYYRRCEAPLHQEAHKIAADVAERKIKLVILDSAAMACGGDLSSPDAAIGLQRALRQIACASLLLAHVAKNVQEGQQATAYGSVFFRELARNVWELTKASDTNPVQVLLTQHKDNFSPRHEPLGFALHFEREAVRVSACNIDDQPDFEAKLPAPSRIRNLLEDGTPRTPKQVADEIGIALTTVQRTLSRYRGHKWQMIGGVGQATQWTVLNPNSK